MSLVRRAAPPPTPYNQGEVLELNLAPIRGNVARQTMRDSRFAVRKILSRTHSKYTLLALLSILSAAAAYLWRGYWAVDALLPNMAAGFLASLLTILFIDRSAEKRLQEERHRIERVAMSQLKRDLIHLTELFSNMIKAAIPQIPSPAPQNLRDLFSPEFTQHLGWLDLRTSAGTLNATAWFLYIDRVLKEVFEDCSNVVDKYLPYLSIELVEQLEAVRNDSFISMLRRMRPACEQNRTPQGALHPSSLYYTESARLACFPKIIALCDLFQRITGDPITVPDSFPRGDVFPLPGSSRFSAIPPRGHIFISGTIPEPPYVNY